MTLRHAAAFLGLLLPAATVFAAPLENIVSVASGSGHTCALTSTGGVKCWGQNYGGQLGDGTLEERRSAVDVVGLSSGVAAIVAGETHSCALMSSGGVKCWGWNVSGQLGLVHSFIMQPTPGDVPGLQSGVVALSSSPRSFSNCALMNTGGAKCWGSNGSGLLGRGTQSAFETVGDVTVVAAPLAAIAIGTDHACALDSAGGVKCWGTGTSGQLGNGNFGSSLSAQDAASLASGVAAVDVEDTHSCALTASGGVKCWGLPADLFGSGQPIASDLAGATSGVASISVGLVVSCLTTTGGGAKCWGRGGLVGDGTMIDRPSAVDVLGLTAGVTQVAAGGSHACAVTVAGNVWCWGMNPSGQLGNRDTVSRSSSPVVVEWFVPQSISFGVLADRSLASGPFQVGATAASGLPVTFTSLTPWTCTVSGTTVSPVSAGACGIAADQAGDVTWDIAPQAVQTFDVTAPPPPAPRLTNLSTRVLVGVSGDSMPIAGFVIGGTSPKTVALRVPGPSLGVYGLDGVNNTSMTVMSGNVMIGANGGWTAGSHLDPYSFFASATSLVASGFAPSSTGEAGLIGTLPPGAYTLLISGGVGFFPDVGTGLVEIYELDKPEVPLINVSTRALVGTREDVMIAGFVVSGDGPLTVAVLGKGPSLAQHGVVGVLGNPALALVRQSDGAVLFTNDDWQSAPNAAALEASGFAPGDPQEAGMLVTLPPGAYTAILSGSRGGTGIGLVEVFRLTN